MPTSMSSHETPNARVTRTTVAATCSNASARAAGPAAVNAFNPPTLTKPTETVRCSPPRLPAVNSSRTAGDSIESAPSTPARSDASVGALTTSAATNRRGRTSSTPGPLDAPRHPAARSAASVGAARTCPGSAAASSSTRVEIVGPHRNSPRCSVRVNTAVTGPECTPTLTRSRRPPVIDAGSSAILARIPTAVSPARSWCSSPQKRSSAASPANPMMSPPSSMPRPSRLVKHRFITRCIISAPSTPRATSRSVNRVKPVRSANTHDPSSTRHGSASGSAAQSTASRLA